jgi:hypothetical protein
MAVLALCLANSGCFITESGYPDIGTGGFAEWRPIEDQRLLAMNERLEVLRKQGAALFAAAAFAETEIMLVRCRREAAAGLKIDVVADLEKLERQMAAIETVMARRPRRA